MILEDWMNKVMLIDGENCCTETLIKHLAFRKDWKVILILGANQNTVSIFL